VNPIRLRTLVAIALLLALVAFGAGCQGIPGLPIGFAPNPSESDIARWALFLPNPADQNELNVRYDQHDNIWNLVPHNKDTCPIICYSPHYNNYQAGLLTESEWGKFLLKFYRAKCKAEDDCHCKELLGLAVEPAPDPVPVAEPAPSAPSHTAPAAPSPPVTIPAAPSVAVPDVDDLKAKINAAIANWLKSKGLK